MNELLKRMLSGHVFMAPADEAASGGGAPEGGADDWADMNDGVEPGADDGGEEVIDPAVGEPEIPEDQGSPSTKDEESGEVPAGEEHENTPPESPPEETPPEQQTPEAQAAEEKALKEQFDQWKQAEIGRLATQYAFDEETASRLQTEPELVLPQLAAQLELNATQRALEAVQRLLPQFVPQVVERGVTEKAATDMFYSKNPDLKKYHKQVLTAGKLFREMNPKATADEAAEKIGNIVRASLGLKATAPTTEATPGTPVRRPHKPAQPGAGGANKPAPAAKTEWEDLLDD